MLKEIKTGSITCQDAINAFTLKAIEATEITNCVTEFLYDQAIVQARSLDEVPIDKRGPLHGLPFSVKEHFFLKGKFFYNWLRKISTFNKFDNFNFFDGAWRHKPLLCLKFFAAKI